MQNEGAANKDWTAIVMKKNRCPPESNHCGAGKVHMDFAVPGYDNLKFSTANTCGSPDTYISREQSSVCPTPATHAILTQLKAGECIRHSI